MATATVSILRRGNYQVAPEPVIFDVTTSGFTLPSYPGAPLFDSENHNLNYLWDFDPDETANLGDFTAPENTDHPSKRYHIGKNPQRVLETGGVHPYRLTVTNKLDHTEVAITEGTIITAARDDFFAQSERYMVGTDFTGAPAHDAGKEYATLELALVAIRGLGSKACILVQPGFTDATNGINLESHDYENIYISAWDHGAGAIPVVDAPSGQPFFRAYGGSGPTTDNTDIVLDHVRVQGDYVSRTAPGTAPGAFIAHLTPSNLTWAVNGCEVALFGTTINIPITHNTDFAVFWDSKIIDYHTAATLGDFGYAYAFNGCLIRNDPDDISTPEGSFVGGWPIRHNGDADYFDVSQSDIFVHRGWVGGDKDDTQHALRLNSHMVEGARFNVNRNNVEGGISVSSSNVSLYTSNYANGQITQNRMALGPYKYLIANLASSGVEFTNNMIIAGSGRNPTGPGWEDMYLSAINLGATLPLVDQTSFRAAPTRIGFNTTVSLCDSTRVNTALRLASPGDYPNLAEGHNVLRAAYQNAVINLGTEGPYTSDGNFDMTQRGTLTHRHQGYHDLNTPRIGTSIPAHRLVEVTGATGAFTEGGVVSQGSVTADLYQVHDAGGGTLRLWIGEPTGGSFAAGTVTDDTSANTATAAGPDIYAGMMIDGTPEFGGPASRAGGVLSDGSLPLFDLYGNRRRAVTGAGAVTRPEIIPSGGVSITSVQV